MKVEILHDAKREFRVIGIDIIPETADESRVLELFNHVPAHTTVKNNIPKLQLLLENGEWLENKLAQIAVVRRTNDESEKTASDSEAGILRTGKKQKAIRLRTI